MKKTSVKLAELILCLGVLIGSVGYYRYSTSADFNPVASHEFNQNVVEASGNRKTDSQNTAEGNMWKKDENSVDNEKTGNADNSNQLTEENTDQNTQQQITASTVSKDIQDGESILKNETDNGNQEGKGTDTVIDIVDDSSKIPGKEPDIILPSVPGNEEGGTTFIPDKGNQGGSSSNGKTDQDVNRPSYAPDFLPDDKNTNDPDVDDKNSLKGSGDTSSHPYYEGVVKNPDDEGKTFHFVVESADDAIYQLYEGGAFSDRYIYYSMNTFIIDENFNRFDFSDKDYGKDNLFIIDWISFDGGKTRITDFPVTVPSGIHQEDVQIGFRYRFSRSSSWKSDVLSDVVVNQNRVFLLKECLSETNHSIQNDMIVNLYDQFPSAGSVLVLNGYQDRLFEMNQWVDSEGRIRVLFPGWYENGKNVGNFYQVTAGRHILQPGKIIPIPDGMELKLNRYFLTPSYVNDVSADDSTPQYIQTLTSFDSDALLHFSGTGEMNRKLVIPEYVQAVDLDQSFSVTCGWMEIPDTVVYINEKTTPLYVTDGFVVDSANPRYSSKDGLLLNKEGTEIEAIPYGKQSLTISSGIRKVHFSNSSNVREITILANNKEEMPELDLDELKGTLIHVQSSVLDSFIQNNLKVLAYNGIRVTSISDIDMVYSVKNDLVIQNGNTLYRCYENADEMVIPSDIQSVSGNAFAGTSVKTVILPENGSVVHFEEGSFSSSSVTKIVATTKKQEEEVSRFLKESGREDISTVLSSVSSDGCYQYYEENGEYVLVKALKNVSSFDGTIHLDNGETVSVSAIAASAFRDLDSLQNVFLNESVKKIGAQAFMNCKELESIFIDNKDSITIGNQAFENCESLRFIGSNAHTGIMENGYDPLISDAYGGKYFYVPTDNEGYSSNCMCFTVESGVSSYSIVDGKYLYGCDEEGTPWILLRALNLSGTAEIADSTLEIWSYAFAGISNAFTVDFDKLGIYNVIYLDKLAFYDSGITEINCNQDYIYVFDSCFAECHDLLNVSLNGTTDLGYNVFDNCSSLKKAEFGTLMSGALKTNMFYGCNSLRKLNLNGYYSYYDKSAPSLLISPGNPFRFNEEWTAEEEVQNLSIHLGEWLDADSIIAAWSYPFIGYGTGADSAYLNLWQDTYFSLMDSEALQIPTDEEVDEKVYETLLNSENRIRAFLGMDVKDAAIPYVIYSQEKIRENDGLIYRINVRGTTDEIDTVDLEEMLDLPSGFNYQIVIQKDAFVKCRNLAGIFLSSKPVFLEDGFLQFAQSQEIGLWSLSGTLPSLVISKEGVPYSFGIDDTRVNFMAFGYTMSEYMAVWEYPLLGYSNRENFENAMKEEVKTENLDLDEESEEFSEKLQKKIQEQEEIAKERIREIVSYIDDDSSEDLLEKTEETKNTEEVDMKAENTEETGEKAETEEENDY